MSAKHGWKWNLLEGAGDGEVEEEFEREAADGDSYLYRVGEAQIAQRSGN